MKAQMGGSRGKAAAVLALAGLLPAAASAGSEYRAMARDLSRAAVRSGAARVAVLPFAAAPGASSGPGRSAAGRLTAQLVRLGKVAVVERELLESVLREQYLMASGAVEGAAARRLGEVLSVDALVTGSIFPRDGELEVQARLIEVAGGRVLAASEARVEAGQEGWAPPVPALEVPVPQLHVAAPTDEIPGLRDALGGDGCDAALGRLEAWESSILEIKARFWAARMKAPGFSRARLISNPGSEIVSPELRSQFYRILQGWHERESVPVPDEAELSVMSRTMSRMAELMRDCGGETGELERAIRQASAW